MTLIYDPAFNEPNSPWFQMFSQAVYKGDIAGALKTGQNGFEQSLETSRRLSEGYRQKPGHS